MSRKTHKSMMGKEGRDGQRRRSPRISAGLDKDNNNQQEQLRSRTKRKFDDSSFSTLPVSKFAKQVWKGRDSPKDADDDHSTDHDCVEWRSAGRDSQLMIIRENQNHDGKASVMPDKHTLELVLDTLQRRDTYEIFAEPVDSDEVEDYYEIIKEPMDFGTMRAKLHEGMYENLEQFEHDVFLIPENAMYFNSSATIYFRQGRALHELARKVFDALKRDPENFVLEFSGTRRRSMRKALSEAKGSVCVGSDVYSKGKCRRASNKKNPAAAGHCYATKFVTGRLCEVGADRRLTYWASTRSSSLYNHQGNKSLLLAMMNEGDIRYKDSLMSYVKDLGPTTQMVAKRKLLLLGLGRQQELNINDGDSTNYWVEPAGSISQRKPPSTDHSLIAKPLFMTFRDFAPAGCSNPFLLPKASTDDLVDLTEEEEEDHGGRKRGAGKEKIVISRNRPIAKKDVLAVAWNNSNHNNHHVAGTSSLRSDDINIVRPVILALENSHSNANAAEYNKSRNKKSSWVRRPLVADRPSISQFTFDLPFLKARLHQMNLPSISSFQKQGGPEGTYQLA